MSQDPRLEKVYSTMTSVLGYVPSDINESASSGSILQLRLVDKISSCSLSRLNINLLRKEFEGRQQMYSSNN